MKKSNLGISLISLIITVIVIIILAAIVIFTGLGTPDQANFAGFVSEFSDFELAVTNDYMDRYTDYALANKTRTKAQIYYEIASGVDVDMNGDPQEVDTIENLGLDIKPEGLKGTEYYEITSDKNVKNWKSQTQYFEAAEKHYVTDEGEVFFLPGYLVEQEDGSKRWWISENQYYVSDTGVRGPSSITVSDVKITTDEAGTLDAGTDLPEGSATLYINFNVAEEGATVMASPTLPYAVTANGAYEFTLTSTSGKTKTYTVTVSNFKEPTLAEKLKIGDYVEYTPVTESNKYITNPAGSGELYTGAASQELTRTENTVWRVIKADESTGEVIITPTDAVNTDTGITLYGAPGYLNHKNILDDICAKLYSNSDLGVLARSMTLEDLDYTVTDSTTRYAYYPSGTPADQRVDVEYPIDSGIIYTAKAHMSSKESPYNDWTFWEYDDYVYSEAQKATYTETVTVGETTYNYTYNYVKPIVITEEDGSKTYHPVLVSGKRYSTSSGTNTSVARACIGATNGWLASSYVQPQPSYSFFVKRHVSSSGFGIVHMAYSDGRTSYNSDGIRPVVPLGTTLKVDISATDMDGKSEATAWKIIKK